VSKLPILSSRDFIKFLTSKGFSYDHTTGSHHVYKLGEMMVTVPERRKGEIKKGLLNGMLNQAGLTREDLIHWWSG
jgi:predicted RNA binding protein YcfA (HicA-like mRNA interferase family)